MKTLYGNAVVGQSGGPTAAINATLSGVLRGAAEGMRRGCIEKIFGMRNGVEGLLEERLTDLSSLAKDPARLQILEQTPAAALGSCRRRLPDPQKDTAVYERLLSIFKKHNIRYFFYIGGNDSMDTVARLSAYMQKNDYEMRVIGVPKTIDNDLVGTDHTPGFGSAAKYIGATLAEILRDTAVYTVPAVTIVEIMGRDAGWLTTAAALPAHIQGIGVDLIYLPERTFSMEDFFRDVEEAFAKHPNVVVAVSEGIRFADGRYVGESAQSGAVDVFGHKYLSGTGKALEIALKEKFGCKVRSVELNLPQRCAAHLSSLADRKESILVGKSAVRAAMRGKTACMMAMVRNSEEYRISVVPKPVAEIANQVRTVPDAYINARGNGVTSLCLEYLAPLIAGEGRTVYQNGLPLHFILQDGE